jgi:hypothetical protein
MELPLALAVLSWGQRSDGLLISVAHLLFSSPSAFKPLAFKRGLFPGSSEKWRLPDFFVELGIWLARICFQNRLSGWAG